MQPSLTYNQTSNEIKYLIKEINCVLLVMMNASNDIFSCTEITVEMRNEKYETRQAIQRCTVWLQDQKEGCLSNTSPESYQEEALNEPFSDPLQESLAYSADEEVSNQSHLGKRHERTLSQDEELSEFSEVSQEPQGPKNVIQVCCFFLSFEDIFLKKKFI